MNKNNTDTFDALIDPKESGWLNNAKERAENRAWRDKAFDIALKLIRHTRDSSITQVKLAEMMHVTPQYINRVFQGKENLTLETICKFENTLNINLIEATISLTDQYTIEPTKTRLDQIAYSSPITAVTINYDTAEYHFYDYVA
jgi:plasmid maintenance system antidote protein VapI